ncbi:MAG TPA: rhamnulokinase family protein [Candidatus Acidoferrales bacterium]|nr:rhamnulokinase family protein [Candidatus Acidoferrales bacterium]
MPPAAVRKATIAVDLGAQSCRVSLLRWNGAQPCIHLVHRFVNSPISSANGLRWDAEGIYRGIVHGLRQAASRAPEGIASIGIDGWAVDYVRLDQDGAALEAPYCYRDPRTETAAARVHEILPADRLYSLTGIQILRINTVYQLYADKLAGAATSTRWLNLPEYMSYRLSGQRVAEYTNATHTGLVSLGLQSWCEEIFAETGLDISAAPRIVPTGTMIGPLRGELTSIAELRGAQLIVPACHDTASAIAAIPAKGDDWAFISSGTWSLVGTVLRGPCVANRARDLNFTNLGGVGGRFYFLKNVNGMWLLQQCLEEWGALADANAMSELVSACESLRAPDCTVDVDAAELLLPGNMIEKLNGQLAQKGHKALGGGRSEAAAVANLILHSLAARYAEVLTAISEITGRKLTRVFVVGGGSRNALLNRLTAERTGLEVIAGSTESTTIGNFAVQLSALAGDLVSGWGPSAESVAGFAEPLSIQDEAFAD